MANSVKILNWVDPDGEFLKFYTELNSEFNVGDRAFIAGGPYDNTNLANIDPFATYAAGYTVMAVDKTNLSNSVTLNISFLNEDFQDSENQTIFSVFDPYWTEEQLANIEILKQTPEDELTEAELKTLQRSNFSNEAWISKNHFRVGEFNGGTFSDGIFGEYKVTNSAGEDAPVDDFETYFNRKEENNNAVWNGGVFLGGSWQWGEWTSKYNADQYGKEQALNSQGGIKDPLDESKLLIREFNNNYDGQGWNQTISGNFGRVLVEETFLRFDEISREIQFAFIPFELKRLLNTGFNVQIEIDILDAVNDIRNNRKYTIDYDPNDEADVNLLNDTNTVKVFERIFSTIGTSTSSYIPASVVITVADPEQTLLDEVDIMIELYRAAKFSDDYTVFNEFMEAKKLKNIDPFKTEKRNNFSTGRFQDCDFFNGLWYNPEFWQIGDFRGGDWWNGEMKYGRIGSRYKKSIWHNGFVNGSENATFANDLFWENGYWLRATWEGARRFKVDSLIRLTGDRTQIQTSIDWENMFTIGDTLLLSYFKGPNSTQYLPNWTNDINQQLLEFQTFAIEDVRIDAVNRRVLLTIPLNLNSLSQSAFTTNIFGETVLDLNYGFAKDIFGENVLDLNYGFARISNSYFDKGVWIDGVWSTGYFNGKLNEITNIIFDANTPDVLGIETDDISNLKLGDFIELSNIKIIHLFNFTGLLPGTNVDDRNDVEFWQNLDQVLQIFDIDIDNKIIYLDLSNLNNDIEEESEIIGVQEFYENSITSWSYQVWENGTFQSGVTENVIWKNGLVDNIFVEDPTNNQIKVVWRSGIWKNGQWNNGAYLSGIWENGTWNNGFMTNGWNRGVEFWTDLNSWQQSDSVWMNGVFNNGRWIRGVWNDGTFNGGIIENGGFDKIDITGGTYTNGRTDKDGNPVYSSELNINRSFGAAPSLVFIDAEGWVQCDQSSWYQRDYNIIFQDLDTNPDDAINDGFPWNNQMFDVLDRDETAAKIKISITGDVDDSGTNGTSGCIGNAESGVSQDIIDASLPIAVVRNIVEIIEIADNVFWVADGSGRVIEEQNGNFQFTIDPETGESLVVNGYDRIIEVDQTSGDSSMALIQKIVNDDSDFDLVYDDILKLETDADSVYAYTLEASLIRRINKTTLENNVVINLTDLSDDSDIQLVTWYDFLIFPNRSNIPETIFIFGLFVEDNVERFNIITVYPNGESVPEFIYFSDDISSNLPTDTADSPFRIMFNEWLATFALNNYSYFDVIFKGFSLSAQLNMYQKLPIDVVSTNTYYENNVQRQIINYQGEKWIMQTSAANYLDVILNDGLEPFQLADFAVQDAVGQEQFWFLNAETRSDIDINVSGVLTTFLNNLDVKIKSIELGQSSLLAVLIDNISPLIIPQDVRRLGVGVADIDPNTITDPIEQLEYAQRTLDLLAALPIEGALRYWMWDYPTSRILKINETNPLFYNEEDEFGVEAPKFDQILFLNKTDIPNELAYFEKTSSQNNIMTLDVSQNIATPHGGGNTLGSVNSTSVFVRATYFANYMYILYYEDDGNVIQYFYDKQSLTSDDSDGQVQIPNDAANANIIVPTHIAASGEVTFADVPGEPPAPPEGRNKIYLVGERGVISSEAVVVFKPDQTELVNNIAIFSQNNLHYMYVTTLKDDVYTIYRLTKLNIDDTIKEWPGYIDNVDFTRLVDGIVYQTTDKILGMRSTVRIEAVEGIEIVTDKGFVVLPNNYTSTAIKNTLNWVQYEELDETNAPVLVKYAYDASNRIVKFLNDTPTLEQSTTYNQYLQPFQYGSYIRNATSTHYVQWTNVAVNQFIIFVDEKVEEEYNGIILEGYINKKKYVRALKIDHNLTNPTNTEITTIFDGDFTLDNLKDPDGNDIFTPSNTAANYDVIDVWAQSSTTDVSIYFVIFDNDTALYKLVTMNSVPSGFDVDILDIADDSYFFTGFNVSRKDLNSINNDVFYLNDLTKVYLLTPVQGTNAILSTIDEIMSVDGIINNVVVSADLAPTESRDHIYLDSTILTFEQGTAGTAGTAGTFAMSTAQQFGTSLSEVVNTFINLHNKISTSTLPINNLFATPPRFANRSVQAFNTVRAFNASALNIVAEKHLYMFIKPTNQPSSILYDDDGNTIFNTMNSINLAYDRTSLLVAQQFGVDTVSLNSTDDPSAIATYNVDAQELVDPGTEVYDYDEYFSEQLPSFVTLFDSEPLFHPFYVEEDGVLYSPVVNGRVLKDTIWGGDNWNTGADTRNLGYTAHLVSSTWLSGPFTGSWDTPSFFNHQVIREESVFLGGVFGNTTDSLSGVWNDGLFLGGTWIQGTFNKGHFISEQPILVDSIEFLGGADTYNRVNQVVRAAYDFGCSLFRLDLEHFYWDTIAYIEAEGRLVQGNLIRVPGLFQDWQLEIYEIRKNFIPIQGQSEIVLITSLPEFDIPDDWLVNSTIYMQGFKEYTEFLHGTHFVTDTFEFGDKFWITIISDFNEFDENGRYEIDYEPLPYISLDPFRIERLISSGTTSSIWFDIPLPPGTQAEQMEFLKENLIISSLDLIEVDTAQDFGTVVSPEQVQVFDRSATGGPSTITFNKVSEIQGMLFDKVDNITYIGTDNINDLVLIESDLNSLVAVEIQNSLVYSGKTDVSIRNSGWLNQDGSGFAHGVSEFAGNQFNGDWTRITSFFFAEESDYLWIELERPLSNISANQFIFLRGFSGNKARLIGSAFSQTFRIQQIDSNRIKIRNPFKFYTEVNISNDRLYRTKFNIGELLLYEKTMQLDVNTFFTFFYSYASNSAWNGGTFVGDDPAQGELVPTFNSVWNGGNFNALRSDATFDGEWFGTPFSYYYTGELDVEVEQQEADFKLTIDLDANGINYNDGDLIYVEFEAGIPEPFYDKIEDGKLSNVYPIFYTEGIYVITLLRYRAAIIEEDFDQLILDHNLDIGPEKDAQYHTIFAKKTFDYSQGNTIFSMRTDPNNAINGILMFNIKYILKALTSQDVIFDMYLNPNSAQVVIEEQTMLNFKLSDTSSVRILLDVGLVKVRYQEISDTTETGPLDAYIQLTHPILGWNHLYVEYINSTKTTKVIFNGTDIYTIDSTNVGGNDVGNTVNWTLDYIGLIDDYAGIPFNKNMFANVTLAQGNIDAKISDQGEVDHLRFWNQPLTDRTSANDVVTNVMDKKYISFIVREIDVKLTFDDRTSEFITPFANDKIILSEVEYINSIILPTDFLIVTEINVQQLNDFLQLFRFNGVEEKVFLLEREADIVKLKIDDPVVENQVNFEIQLSTNLQFYIREDRIIIKDINNILLDQTIDIIASGTDFSIGNSNIISYLSSILVLNNTIIFNQNSDEFITALLTGETSLLSSDSIETTLNKRTLSDVSSDFLIYPPSSAYPTIQQSSNPDNPGSALVTLGTDYQTWTYMFGDSIYTAAESDANGSNIEIWGTSGQPDLDYYIAEIFQLDENGQPVWSIDNVSWQSKFTNAEYLSKLWRAGEFNGGFIRNTGFIWKWGINSGGGIIDTST